MLKVVEDHLVEVKSVKGMFKVMKVIVEIQTVTASRVLRRRVTGAAFCWFSVRVGQTFMNFSLICYKSHITFGFKNTTL